ncbi:putative glycoprotein 2 [Changping earthworm virus 2]|uniref:putative glycoprotein 2 n=1 Tax=Changping earthworm virus 2 TaxID=1922827 RepID=UPI00090B7197|nr:putative glycoprotein 2 [Changping earthworm virus 2]APG77873.1 putative glycoprotein 2 [Changping earthworm virus 2]
MFIMILLSCAYYIASTSRVEDFCTSFIGGSDNSAFYDDLRSSAFLVECFGSDTVLHANEVVNNFIDGIVSDGFILESREPLRLLADDSDAIKEACGPSTLQCVDLARERVKRRRRGKLNELHQFIVTKIAVSQARRKGAGNVTGTKKPGGKIGVDDWRKMWASTTPLASSSVTLENTTQPTNQANQRNFTLRPPNRKKRSLGISNGEWVLPPISPYQHLVDDGTTLNVPVCTPKPSGTEQTAQYGLVPTEIIKSGSVTFFMVGPCIFDIIGGLLGVAEQCDRGGIRYIVGDDYQTMPVEVCPLNVTGPDPGLVFRYQVTCSAKAHSIASSGAVKMSMSCQTKEMASFYHELDTGATFGTITRGFDGVLYQYVQASGAVGIGHAQSPAAPYSPTSYIKTLEDKAWYGSETAAKANMIATFATCIVFLVVVPLFVGLLFCADCKLGRARAKGVSHLLRGKQESAKI